MDKALTLAPCGAGPHDEDAERATFEAITNAPSMEDAIEIANPHVCDPFKISRAVLPDMGLSEAAITATLEDFDDLAAGCDCRAVAEMDETYEPHSSSQHPELN
jgi:hypothetical protein